MDKHEPAEIIKEYQDKYGKTYGYRRGHILLERDGIHKNPKPVLGVVQKVQIAICVPSK